MAIEIIANRYVLDPAHFRQGGSSVVVKARDHQTDELVAVKFYSGASIESAVLEEFFFREREALESLRHPNIVELRDAGFDSARGQYYLVLEWLEQSLPDVLRDTPAEGWDSFADAVLTPVLEALVFAHSRRILHRDIKPPNIMISDGRPKLADFGIAKLLDSLRFGMTVNDFASRLYAPPERSRGEFDQRGDLYSLGVTTLACLVPRDLTMSPDKLEDAIWEADLPDPANVYLRKLIAADPSQRFLSSAVALKELRLLQKQRPAEEQPRHTLHLKLTAAVKRELASAAKQAATTVEDVVSNDLSGELAIRLFSPNQSETDDRRARDDSFNLYGDEYVHHIAIDRGDASRLVIVNSILLTPSLLEGQRERAMSIPAHITFGHVLNRSKAIESLEWLRLALAEHEQVQRLRREEQQEQYLFNKWWDILEAKQRLENNLEAPVTYRSYRIQPPMVEFELASQSPTQEMVGQTRKVRIAEAQWLSGTVEAVSDRNVILFVEQGDPKQLPREGQLRVDREASLVAIRRQKAAVEATRNARTVRSDLGTLLIHPENALPPQPAEGLVFAQELDNKKQRAVMDALGSPDFMTVVGPPGTGKTTFIAELALQFKKRHPHGRVLITAQTHVAVDNAILRLRNLDPDLRIIRVGMKERLAQDVAELSVDRQLDKWRLEATSQATNFLNHWAATNGIDRQFAETLSAIEQVRLSEAGLDNVNSQLEALRKTEFELTDELTDPLRHSGGDQNPQGIPVTTADPAEAVEISLSDALTSVQGEIDVLTAEEKRLSRTIARLRRAIARTLKVDAAAPTVEFLRTFHDRYHPDPSALARLGELETLQQEWLQRFGQGVEFVGALISMADVVAGTCVGIASVRFVDDIEFDLVIIDEASKATPTEALVPMVMGKKWVLVGDPNQLPPFLDKALTDPATLQGTTLNLEDLKTTLFDRLLTGLPDANQVSLTVQHRMIKPIGDLVSHCFYRETLESPVERGSLTSLVKYLPVPVVWFSTSNLPGRREASDGKSSFINQTEIARIATLLTSLDRLAELSNETLSVAVISAYDAQKRLLTRELQPQSQRWSTLRIDINTVDAFQGQERDVVVYSVTRSNEVGELGFLRSDRRLNVALSRGREALTIVGDSRFYELARSQDNPFRCVLDYIRLHPDTCRLEYVDQ